MPAKGPDDERNSGPVFPGALPPRRRWLNYVWPQMGWRRYLSYLRHRLGRLPGTAHSIAAGFASGAAMSMTPLMGFHFLLAALLAWLVRGNLLASAIGTAVGNPWTFPFIWMWIYNLGCFLMGIDAANRPFHGFSFVDVMHDPWETLKPVLTPMVVGSVPSAIVLWWLTYWPLYKLIEQYKRQRMERRHRRALKVMERQERESGNRND